MIRVGTAAWVDEGLLEDWYPIEVAHDARGRLAFYQQHFDVVELDASYYSLLPPRMAQQWVSQFKAGFTMHVKAYRALTRHWLEVEGLPADLKAEVKSEKKRVYARDLPHEIYEECWRRFLSFLSPLHTSGHLGYLLFQFPEWFRPGPSSLAYLEEVARRTQGYLTAIEFRHPSWYCWWEETRALLMALNLAHITVDAPRVLEAPDRVAEATHSGCAILRCHGRNAQTWKIKGSKASQRFNYWYSGEELRELLEVGRELEGQADLVWVIFNNNYSTQSVDGARGVLQLLAKPQQECASSGHRKL